MTLTLLESIRRHRLFEQDSLLLRLGPFAVAYASVLLLFPLGPTGTYGAVFAAAVAAGAVTLAAIAFVPWERLPEAAQLLPIATYLLSIALFREAHGGVTSGYASLVLVAVVWVAIFGRRRALAATIVGVVVAIGLPPLLASAPAYPTAGELRRAATMMIVAALCGAVIQWLVRALVAAEANLKRIRADEVHDDLVQAFAVAQLALDTGDVRMANQAVRGGLTAAQSLSARMLDEAMPDEVEPGMLRRTRSSTPPGTQLS
jgi:hypothetical protein